MAHAILAGTHAGSTLRDAIDLAKPRISSMVVFTTAVGLAVAPGSIGAPRSFLLLVGTALLVASANIFNSWYERDTDALMARTRLRPLPAGRFDPWSAVALAILTGTFAVPILAIAVNPLTALLGAVAHATYVLVYTPLKRVTPWALEIGAIPGAIPPLMGWTAATGSFAPEGWFLFAILFLWQVPHFLAIALYLRDDYARGGIRVLPVVRGEAVARRRLLAYTVALTAVSLAAIPLGMAGAPYGVAAATTGTLFVGLAAQGVVTRRGSGWARRVMLYSLVHLVVVVVALVLDAR